MSFELIRLVGSSHSFEWRFICSCEHRDVNTVLFNYECVLCLFNNMMIDVIRLVFSSRNKSLILLY